MDQQINEQLMKYENFLFHSTQSIETGEHECDYCQKHTCVTKITHTEKYDDGPTYKRYVLDNLYEEHMKSIAKAYTYCDTCYLDYVRDVNNTVCGRCYSFLTQDGDSEYLSGFCSGCKLTMLCGPIN